MGVSLSNAALTGAARYGRELVGDLSARVNRAAEAAPLYRTWRSTPRLPLLFFDLETTGLSGGAGTHVFLVGCGWFDEAGGFVTRQFLLTRFADERPLLAALTGELTRAGALVTFNGKSFDAPLIGNAPFCSTGSTGLVRGFRTWTFFIRPGDSGVRAPRGLEKSSCSLGALERQILGAGRTGDVSGFEIPARYFQFVRSGDARPWLPCSSTIVWICCSLAGLHKRLLDVVRDWPWRRADAREGAGARRCLHACRRRAARPHRVRARRGDGRQRPRRRQGRQSARPGGRAAAFAALRRRRRVLAPAARRAVVPAGVRAREASEALAMGTTSIACAILSQLKTFALKSLEHGLPAGVAQGRAASGRENRTKDGAAGRRRRRRRDPQSGLAGGGCRRFLRLRGCDLAAFRRLRAVLLGEPLDAPFGIQQFLLAGEERMTIRADFEVQLGLG